MSTLLEHITQWLKRVITQPLEELDRWQTAIRFAYDLGRFGARQLRYDRAQQMAAALAFRTLFGLLPVLVVGTVLVKALGMEQQYLTPLSKLFEMLGLNEVHILPPAGLAEDSTTLSVWLHDRVRDAGRVSFAAVGWVGVAVTVYAAIGLVVTIENAFNIIYRASAGRRWTSRVPMYWFALTISPVIIIASYYVDARFHRLLDGLDSYRWLSTVIGWAWSMSVLWLLMFVVYVLFPNTKVHLRPAAIGAFVAAFLLEVGKRTMGMYLQNAISLSQLYGSLGLIPLFMFWVYLMWLAVLFGLQVSSTLQHLHGRQLDELEQQRLQSALVDTHVVIVLMRLIARRFRQGAATEIDELADAVGVPEPIVDKIADALVQAGFLHRVADAEPQVVLSRPPEHIAIAQLLTIAQQLVDRDVGDERTEQLLQTLRQAQHEAAATATLASLVA